MRNAYWVLGWSPTTVTEWVRYWAWAFSVSRSSYAKLVSLPPTGPYSTIPMVFS